MFTLNEITAPVQDWNNIVDDTFLGEWGKTLLAIKKPLNVHLN